MSLAQMVTVPGARGESPTSATLKVLTLNVWHGLRSGESRWRFPGEEPERRQRRLRWQLDELRRLDPDVLLLQELNPNRAEARRYASELGLQQIHKVTSCGIHLGPLFKIPRNVNEGLAILAKPGLGMRRMGAARLSGNARCSASWGFQTRESRYVLAGTITVAGRAVLVATTHLSAPPPLPPRFEQQLGHLVDEGILEPDQRKRILAQLRRQRSRHLAETGRLLAEIGAWRARLADHDRTSVLLGGDFNVEPDSPSLELVERSGLKSLTAGRQLATWDPVVNRVNHSIAAPRTTSLPSFDIPEVEELLAAHSKVPRQIDYLYASQDASVVTIERVMTRDRRDLFASDHFGILAALQLPGAPGTAPATP